MKRLLVGIAVVLAIVIGVVLVVGLGSGDHPDRTSKVDPSSISRAGIAPALHGFAGTSESGFRVGYAPSQDPGRERVRDLFVRDQVFERIAHALNQLVVMKTTVDIQLVDCGAPNAFYDPNGHRIIVCYELVAYFVDTFRPHASGSELGAAVMGATVFAFFHELGHCLIHELGLPSTGREEDGADQIATLILLDAGDQGVDMALAGARWFALLAADNAQRTPFWDEHAFDGQRFFNILCLIYGEKPQARAGMVNKLLPETRAKRCPGEHRAIAEAWDKLLAPHLRQAAAAGAPPERDAGPSCDDVAARALEVIRRDAAATIEQELAAAAAADRDAVAATIEERLRSVAANIARRCASERWPGTVRDCLTRVSTTEDASRCML